MRDLVVREGSVREQHARAGHSFGGAGRVGAGEERGKAGKAEEQKDSHGMAPHGGHNVQRPREEAGVLWTIPRVGGTGGGVMS